MKLKSFGCSFIFGSELSDDGSHTNYDHYSRLSWPALLAKTLGYDYDCYARPGAGNLRILEAILSQAESNENDLYVIGWTWIDRFDYKIDDAVPVYRRDATGWSTILPNDSNKQAEFYYKHLYSQFTDKLTTLAYIKLAVDTLNQKNIPFIMTYMDDLIFESQWHSTPAVAGMQNYIQPYVSTFQGKNFIDWSRDQNLPVSQSLHPLEAAHQAAADLVYQELDHWIRP